jgi:hypothetical protein
MFIEAISKYQIRHPLGVQETNLGIVDLFASPLCDPIFDHEHLLSTESNVFVSGSKTVKYTKGRESKIFLLKKIPEQNDKSIRILENNYQIERYNSSYKIHSIKLKDNKLVCYCKVPLKKEQFLEIASLSTEKVKDKNSSASPNLNQSQKNMTEEHPNMIIFQRQENTNDIRSKENQNANADQHIKASQAFKEDFLDGLTEVECIDGSLCLDSKLLISKEFTRDESVYESEGFLLESNYKILFECSNEKNYVLLIRNIIKNIKISKDSFTRHFSLQNFDSLYFTVLIFRGEIAVIVLSRELYNIVPLFNCIMNNKREYSESLLSIPMILNSSVDITKDSSSLLHKYTLPSFNISMILSLVLSGKNVVILNCSFSFWIVYFLIKHLYPLSYSGLIMCSVNKDMMYLLKGPYNFIITADKVDDLPKVSYEVIDYMGLCRSDHNKSSAIDTNCHAINEHRFISEHFGENDHISFNIPVNEHIVDKYASNSHIIDIGADNSMTFNKNDLISVLLKNKLVSDFKFPLNFKFIGSSLEKKFISFGMLDYARYFYDLDKGLVFLPCADIFKEDPTRLFIMAYPGKLDYSSFPKRQHLMHYFIKRACIDRDSVVLNQMILALDECQDNYLQCLKAIGNYFERECLFENYYKKVNEIELQKFPRKNSTKKFEVKDDKIIGRNYIKKDLNEKDESHIDINANESIYKNSGNDNDRNNEDGISGLIKDILVINTCDCRRKECFSMYLASNAEESLRGKKLKTKNLVCNKHSCFRSTILFVKNASYYLMTVENILACLDSNFMDEQVFYNILVYFLFYDFPLEEPSSEEIGDYIFYTD